MFETVQDVINTVSSQEHGSVWLVFFIGVVFGIVIQWSRVDTFEKIAGFSMLKDFTMIKLVLLATGISAIGLYFMVQNGYASYSPKPIIVGGLVIGGLLFGAGMSIFGKCPGTGTISLAEGRIDVLVGIIGGVVAGGVFIIFFDDIKSIIGDNLGKIQLIDWTGEFTPIFVIIFGILLIVASILIPNREIHYDKE